MSWREDNRVEVERGDTMNESLFDLEAGRSLRDRGIKRAIDHADRIRSAWSVEAWGILKAFLLVRSHEFMTEDFRAWAYENTEIELPPDGRAWGGIIVRAVKSGMIKKVGYRPMKSKNCHANPKAVWVACR
jgi:hypothetical protein